MSLPKTVTTAERDKAMRILAKSVYRNLKASGEGERAEEGAR